MPIRFDDAAADTLVDQLELTVRSLVQLADYLHQMTPTTTEDWHGRFREAFDRDLSQHIAEARILASDLHLVAVAVRAGQFEAAATRQAELAQSLQASPPSVGIRIIPRAPAGHG